MIDLATRKTALALILITALAFFLRLYRIDSLPPGYWFDEAHKSLAALEIAAGARAPIYLTDYSGIEAGYAWLLAGWFKLFGPGYYGTRYLSAALGAVTPPLTWWTVRTIYRAHPRADRLGLVSAGGLAVLLWHVHWSRLGLETIAVPLFSVVVLGTMAWAWQRRTDWAFALAGVALGLSQYTNPGARVLPIQALLAFALFADWRPILILRFGLVFLLAALLIYAPLGWFFVNEPRWFLNRIAFASANAGAGGLPFYFDNLLKIFLSFNWRGDALPRHNLSLRPALDVAASLWLWVGAVSLARDRAHWRAHGSVLGALAVNLMPMIFSDGAPGWGRMLGATPFLMMIPAVGIVAGWEWTRLWIGRAAISLSLIVSISLNVYDYFERYPRQPGLFDAFQVGLWTLTQSAARAGESGVGYLILDEAGLQHPATQLTRALTVGDLRMINGQTCLAYPARTQTAVTISVMPRWLEAVRAEYPTASQLDVMHEPEAYLEGAVLTIPAGQVSSHGRDATRPAARLGGMFDLLALETRTGPARPGESVALRLRWLAHAAAMIRYTTFVHLADASRPFITGVDGEPCAGWYPTDQWHADEIIEYTLLLSLPADLQPGAYDLAVGMYDWRTGERLAVSQTNPREPDRAFVATLVIK